MNKTDKKLTSRDTVIVAVFGALWGLVEITLGVTLKGLRIPLGGAILTAIATVIFLTGRYFVPKRGSILMMGAVAAILKVFSVGIVIAGPFLAILIEAALAEAVVSISGINRMSYLITANLLLIYVIVHPFIAQGMIFGTDIYKIYLETFHSLAELLHMEIYQIGWIAGIYVFIHLILGSFAGYSAYLLARRADREFDTKIENAGHVR